MSTQIDALPDAPAATDPVETFDAKAFAFNAALQTFRSQTNALGSEMQTNADVAAALITAMALPQFMGTSTSSLAIGTGAKSFATQTGKEWVVGQVVIASSGSNYMKGQVAAYNAGTGVLDVNVTSVNGSGTFASWTIGLSYEGLSLAKSGDNNDIFRLDALNSALNAVGVGSRHIGLPTPTVSANAMTMPGAIDTFDFRSDTLASGGATTITGTLSPLIVPAGATLGGQNGVAQDLAWLVLNFGGVMEYAVVNAAGGVDLSETGVISTTAISSGSTSESQVYSAVARTNVPYRLAGFSKSTQAVAGQWAAASSWVNGGVSPLALWLAGYGQKSRAMTAFRGNGSTHYNTTGRTIWIQVYWKRGANTVGYVNLSTVVNGFTEDVKTKYFNTTDESINTGWVPIPAWASYSVTQSVLPSGMVWNERF